EVRRVGVVSTSLRAAPRVGALRERAEEVRLEELRRYARQLARLDDEHRDLVDMITRGLIAKLLHEPSVRLREQAGSPRGDPNPPAVAALFDLGFPARRGRDHDPHRNPRQPPGDGSVRTRRFAI